MTDSEKIALINVMIADCLEYLTEEQMEKGALALVTAIESVTEFNGKELRYAEN